MIDLYITAEGETELNFALKILRPHLAEFHVFVDARCVLTSKDKRTSNEFRGGVLKYAQAQKDIYAWCQEKRRSHCRFTTMFDLYALPDDFPGYVAASQEADPYKRVSMLEKNMAQSIRDGRFIPYIQLHEFEALILAAPQNLDWEYLEHETQIRKLISMVENQNPELINDGGETAPSKRILKEIPEYDKVTSGVAVVQKTGLPTLRAKCGHFNEWLSRLERLAGVSP